MLLISMFKSIKIWIYTMPFKMPKAALQSKEKLQKGQKMWTGEN